MVANFTLPLTCDHDEVHTISHVLEDVAQVVVSDHVCV